MYGNIELNKLPSVFDDVYPQPIDATPVLYTAPITKMDDMIISVKDMAEALGYVRFAAFYKKQDGTSKWVCGIVEHDKYFSSDVYILWETECYADTLDYLKDEIKG